MNLFEAIEKLLADGIDPESRTEEIWRQFGRRYAALIIDSSGFTRTVEKHGPLHYLARMARIRSLSQPILHRNGAHMHGFAADNIHAYFETVDQAVESTRQLHQAIGEAGITLADGEPFSICAGIGYGDLLYSETLEGCFGHEMNLASKLGEDTADRDQLLMTRAAYDACAHDLKSGMTSAKIGIAGTMIDYYQTDLGQR